MEHFLHVLAALVIAHALCDYPLQGDFLSKAKSPAAPLPDVPWPWALGAHCAIQAGGVWIVTGSLVLAIAEFVAHWWIDVAKCWRRISFSTDQVLHLATKAVLALAVCVR